MRGAAALPSASFAIVCCFASAAEAVQIHRQCRAALCRVGSAGAAASLSDWPALVQAALVQLFGVIGGGVPFDFQPEPSAGGSAGLLTVDKR